MSKVLSFGARLRAARKRRGLSPERLAEAAGLRDRTIYNYEGGYSSPTLRTLEKLGDALGLTVPELLSEGGRVKQPKERP